MVNAAGINGPCGIYFKKIVLVSFFWDQNVSNTTHRTVIKWRATDSDGREARWLGTCRLYVAYTISAIRAVHIYGWSWWIRCRKASSCVCRVRRCWRSKALRCSSLIIIHYWKWRENTENISVSGHDMWEKTTYEKL